MVKKVRTKDETRKGKESTELFTMFLVNMYYIFRLVRGLVDGKEQKEKNSETWAMNVFRSHRILFSLFDVVAAIERNKVGGTIVSFES